MPPLSSDGPRGRVDSAERERRMESRFGKAGGVRPDVRRTAGLYDIGTVVEGSDASEDGISVV